jgi:hypothetical protein
MLSDTFEKSRTAIRLVNFVGRNADVEQRVPVKSNGNVPSLIPTDNCMGEMQSTPLRKDWGGSHGNDDWQSRAAGCRTEGTVPTAF